MRSGPLQPARVRAFQDCLADESQIKDRKSKNGILPNSARDACGLDGSAACKISSDIVAEPDSTIRVTVQINGVTQESYTLSQVSKETFVGKFKTVMAKAGDFSISEADCQKTLGTSCESLWTDPNSDLM
jgi:hypothetical protein